MEAPEYLLPSGPHRAGSGQFSEKQGKVVGGCEHFMVEDLLDFSNEDDGLGGGEVLEDGLVIDMASGNSADSSTVTAMDCSSNSGSDPRFPNEPIGLTGELCVPYDDLEELEWLSSFVEESFSSEDLQKLQLISGVKYTSSSEARSEVCTIPTTRPTPTVAAAANTTTTTVAAANTSTPTPTPTTIFVPEKPVCSKARSKRSRAAPCSWASRIVVLSHNNATPTSSADDSDLLPPPPSDIPPAKKAPKTVKKKETHDVLAPAPDGRKCLHCATDKTPQWRTGPMGPKTLCNACGVRYKSGRLVPEYRPAASPTFVLSKHSNSHRKVMELRRQKELLQQQHSAQFLHHHSHHQLSPIYDMVTGGADEFLIHHQVGPDFRQLI